MGENIKEKKEEFTPKSIQIRKTILSSMREWLATRGDYRKDSLNELISRIFMPDIAASVLSYNFTMHNYPNVVHLVSVEQLLHDTSSADTTTFQIVDELVYDWAKEVQEHCHAELKYDVSLGQIVEGEWMQFLISEKDPDAKRFLESVALISVSDNFEDEVCIDYTFYRYYTSYAYNHYWRLSTTLDQNKNWLAILLIRDREKALSLTSAAEVSFDDIADEHVTWGESVIDSLY